MAQATPILHPPGGTVTIPFAPGTTKTLALFYARKDVKAAHASGRHQAADGRRCRAQVVLLDPVIHLYWAHALARAEEMLKVVCGAQAEREHVTLDSKKITCPSCRERAKARSGSEQER
jgi:hypothetical protein